MVNLNVEIYGLNGEKLRSGPAAVTEKGRGLSLHSGGVGYGQLVSVIIKGGTISPVSKDLIDKISTGIAYKGSVLVALTHRGEFFLLKVI